MFKNYIGMKLKEKILKNKSLSVTDLMASVSMCLDLEGLRIEIIQYALNSEVFYSFTVSYYITILRLIERIGLHDDFIDLLRAIQI